MGTCEPKLNLNLYINRTYVWYNAHAGTDASAGSGSGSGSGADSGAESSRKQPAEKSLSQHISVRYRRTRYSENSGNATIPDT